MRSYFVSLSLVSAVLLGYTALVLTNRAPAKSEAPRVSIEADERQPANTVGTALKQSPTGDVNVN